MVKNGSVQVVNKTIDMKTLSGIYLLHFIYVPIIVIYAISIGEDIGSIGLYVILTFIVSLMLYGYNLFITTKGLNFFPNKYLAFVLPVMILIVLYIPLNWFLQELDIGGKFGVLYILVGTLIINTISYFLLSK